MSKKSLRSKSEFDFERIIANSNTNQQDTPRHERYFSEEKPKNIHLPHDSDIKRVTEDKHKPLEFDDMSFKNMNIVYDGTKEPSFHILDNPVHFAKDSLYCAQNSERIKFLEENLKVKTSSLANCDKLIAKGELFKYDNIGKLNQQMEESNQSHSSDENNQKGTHSTLDDEYLKKIIRNEKEQDNDYEFNECFVKLRIEEFNTAFYTIISITSGILYNEFRNQGADNESIQSNNELKKRSIQVCLAFVSIGVFFFIISSINRYLIILKLNKSSTTVNKRTGFFNRRFIWGFVFEVVLALLHPNLAFEGICFYFFLFRDITYTTDEVWYLMEITYPINDFFILILLARIYVVFRFLISLTKFYNARAARIAKLIGTRFSRLFAVRCIVEVYPYTFLIISGTLIVAVLAFMLRVIEGPVYLLSKASQESKNDYRKIQNCIWNILVTMTTVGYGDYYPITNLGRLINIIAAIFGTVLISLMVISLQNGLKFSDNEERAFNFREKSLSKKKIEEMAAKYFKTSFDYHIAKKKYRQTIREGKRKETISRIKKDIERLLYKKIDSKRIFKNLIQSFRNTYEFISESDILKTKLDDIQLNLFKVTDNCQEMENEVGTINEILSRLELKAALKKKDGRSVANENTSEVSY